MIKAILVEIKHTILKTWFHLVRFGGLLLIPFIYGFSYIFAFYNPFEHSQNLPIAIVTSSKKNVVDKTDFAYYLGETFKNETKLELGELNVKVKPDHIYLDDTINNQKKLKEIKQKYYATIYIPNLTTSNNFLKDSISKLKNGKILGAMENIEKYINSMNKKIVITNNYKKNYLIAFGVDLGTSMYGTSKFVIDTFLKTLTNEDALRTIGFTDFQKITSIKSKAQEALRDLSYKIHPIKIESQMGGEKAKYGYGLAPFFISISMWIGGMVMTFAVHKKIYDKTIPPIKRYFAKMFLILTGTILQATILMTSLYFIGFEELGVYHWVSMYMFAILIGMIFAILIQAIRFSIPNRNLGIFITIILLVIQMASGGGLYPIEMQSDFYQIANKILPLGYAINIIREATFDTSTIKVLTYFGYLLLYLAILPLGIYVNYKQTLKFYKNNNWGWFDKQKKLIGGVTL